MSKEELVNRYFALSKLSEKAISTVLEGMPDYLAALNLPLEKASYLMKQSLSVTALNAAIRPVYVANISEAALKAAVAFMESPEGQTFLVEQMIAENKSRELVATYIQDVMTKVVMQLASAKK